MKQSIVSGVLTKEQRRERAYRKLEATIHRAVSPPNGQRRFPAHTIARSDWPAEGPEPYEGPASNSVTLGGRH